MPSGYRWFGAALLTSVGMLSLAMAPQAGKGTGKVPIDVLQKSQPVEADVHEFMELYNEPAYKRLKASLGSGEVSGKSAWSSIKSDALQLAEAGNLILLRPEEDAQAWAGHAVRVRQAGSELYASAQGERSAQVRQHFQALLNACNACHDEFADGIPNLKVDGPAE